MMQYYVALFRGIDDPMPFTTIPMRAKMPLGALVFALKQAHVTRVAHVAVTWEAEQPGYSYQTDFYHVIVGRTKLTYDRVVEGEPAPDNDQNAPE